MKTALKRMLWLVAMLFVVSLTQAQTQQEVVYLKNGSIIRGVIIEQIPNISLKIQTPDGSIFAYQMDEVEKITKEAATKPYSSWQSGSRNYSGLESGYRGFVDLGYTIGTGAYGEDRIEFATSHGYQCNPYIYAGIGVGVQYYFDSEVVEIPIFAHVRSEFIKGPVSPLIDFRIGYTVYDEDGFYMTPAIGCRFAVGQSNGLSLLLGYTMQRYDVPWGGTENCGGFSIKVGFDF